MYCTALLYCMYSSRAAVEPLSVCPPAPPHMDPAGPIDAQHFRMPASAKPGFFFGERSLRFPPRAQRERGREPPSSPQDSIYPQSIPAPSSTYTLAPLLSPLFSPLFSSPLLSSLLSPPTRPLHSSFLSANSPDHQDLGAIPPPCAPGLLLHIRALVHSGSSLSIGRLGEEVSQ